MNNLLNTKIQIAVVGANGYTGLELIRLLLAHPNVQLAALFTRNSSWHLNQDLPHAPAILHYSIEKLPLLARNFDCVFLATPAELSLTLVPNLIQQGVKVIDLSGAFRLSADEYEHWYGQPHSAAHLLTEVHYGLSPWGNAAITQQTSLIANPGCYATCIMMALLPLLEANLIETDPIFIDAKSGISGAGRKAEQNLLFTPLLNELSQNFYPYKIGQHQHTPEIIRYTHQFTNTQTKPVLVTQVLPVIRGLIASIYVKLKQPWASSDETSLIEKLKQCFANAYANYPLLKNGYLQSQSTIPLSLKQVANSNYTHIGYQRQQSYLLLFSSIDNLLKGAASQALENFNILWQLPLTTGLMPKQEEVTCY